MSLILLPLTVQAQQAKLEAKKAEQEAIEAEAEFLDFQVPEGTAVGSTIIIEVRPHPPLPPPLPASVPLPAGSS